MEKINSTENRLKQVKDDIDKCDNPEIYKEEDKYIMFKTWLQENGAIFSNFDYPVAFTKFNIIGVSAKNKITNNEAMLYVPKKLINDSSEIKHSKIIQLSS